MRILVDGNHNSAVIRLMDTWQKMGHSIVNSPNEADVQLCIVKIRIKSDLPKVLRLDGVYYQKDIPWQEYNKLISKAHSTSNAIVYQSEVSKIFCEKYLEPRTGMYDTIYNGINPESWNNPLEHDGINMVSTSLWRRWKRLPEIVEVFNTFRDKYHENITLHIVGEMGRGAEKIDDPDIVYHNYLNHDYMRGLYRSMDLYLHIAKNDSCPNTIIEAIAAGLPVITTNACGGVTEICKFTEGCYVVSGETVSYEVDSIYGDKWNKLPENVKRDLAERMIVTVHPNKERSIFPDVLHIDNVAKKYIDVMEKII